MVDVEANGPLPGSNSMFMVGVVKVDETGCKHRFLGKLKPVFDKYDDIGYTLANTSHQEMRSIGEEPGKVMADLAQFLQDTNVGRSPMFYSDNNGYDFMWVTWYFHLFYGSSPFGHSSTNIGSLYKGLVGDTFKNFKHLRRTAHTHNPVDDCLGNAEALLYMKQTMGLKINLD